VAAIQLWLVDSGMPCPKSRSSDEILLLGSVPCHVITYAKVGSLRALATAPLLRTLRDNTISGSLRATLPPSSFAISLATNLKKYRSTSGCAPPSTQVAFLLEENRALNKDSLGHRVDLEDTGSRKLTLKKQEKYVCVTFVHEA